MTVANQIKILDSKTMQNEAQHDLDKKPAKISALSSNNFNNYKYLTGEDLGWASKIWVWDLGSLNLLKNIEGKNEQQLKAIRDKINKQLNAIKNISINSKKLQMINSFSKISPETEKK